jgi:hypothetical protein
MIRVEESALRNPEYSTSSTPMGALTRESLSIFGSSQNDMRKSAGKTKQAEFGRIVNIRALDVNHTTSPIESS